MIKQSALLLLSILSFFQLQEGWAQNSKPRPKIGLVLKGGGALGLAHVGVLKVLEHNRIPVDLIAGTSMGSIVGAAYASGSTIEEMETVLSETDWGELFGERLNRQNIDYRLKAGRQRELFGDVKFGFLDGNFIAPQGVVEGQNIRILFQRLFRNPATPTNFDDLPIPFRAVTADLETGEVFTPAFGDLATTVRASMSIPGAFSPVEIDGRLLVDGGIANNLPVDVVLGMGADILIVVDLQSDLAKRSDLTSPFSITGQMISMLLVQNSAHSLTLVRPQDVVISPNVNGFTVTDFPRGVELMAIGEKTADAKLAQLQKLSISAEEYEKYQAKRTQKQELPEYVNFIRINNKSSLSEGRIRDLLSFREGDVLDLSKLEADTQKLYAMGYFSSVTYSLVKEGEKSGVEVNLRGRDWLEQFVKLGFSLEDNLDGDESFRLGASFRSYNISTKDAYLEAQAEIGKTPRLSMELYQPLSEESLYFVAPKVGLSRSSLYIRDGTTALGEYGREEEALGLSLGRKISTTGEIAASINRATGSLSRQVGSPSLPELDYDIGDLGIGIDLDSLDRPDFPSSGYRFATTYTAAVESIGAPNDFQDLSGALTVPYNFGRNTIVLKNFFATTFGERPVERSYSLGGFVNVSGVPYDSLTASNYNSGGFAYFRRFSEVENPFFNLAVYSGFTYELTTIHNTNPNFKDYSLINSGSVFVGADTPLLPVYLGFGISDTSEHSIYIAFGRIGKSGR